MNSPPFVERAFEAGDDTVVCRFFTPQLEATGDYSCRYQIDWPQEGARQVRIFGIDAVQALLLAMRSAHRDLVGSDAYRAGRLTYLGEPDLGLPLLDPSAGEV